MVLLAKDGKKSKFFFCDENSEQKFLIRSVFVYMCENFYQKSMSRSVSAKH